MCQWGIALEVDIIFCMHFILSWLINKAKFIAVFIDIVLEASKRITPIFLYFQDVEMKAEAVGGTEAVPVPEVDNHLPPPVVPANLPFPSG